MIVITQGTCGGQPRIEGHRITVIDILRQFAGNLTIKEISEDFCLTEEEIIEAVLWCAHYIDEQF